jgi:hypothetical protein
MLAVSLSDEEDRQAAGREEEGAETLQQLDPQADQQQQVQLEVEAEDEETLEEPEGPPGSSQGQARMGPAAIHSPLKLPCEQRSDSL